MFSEMQGVFVAGVVFGSVFTALLVAAWAWDAGFKAGASWQWNMRQIDEIERGDSIEKVL